MNATTFRRHLDIITTILVVALFVTMAVVYVHGKFYKKQVDPAGSTVAKDLKIADALKLEYKTHSRTLILALDKNCTYCERSAGFYKRLIQSQANEAGNTQLVAVLPNDDWEATHYLRQQGLEQLPHVSNVKLSQLKISAMPTLILVDRLGRVVESWRIRFWRLSTTGHGPLSTQQVISPPLSTFLMKQSPRTLSTTSLIR
jgi:thioredoxin-related protein